ncbi:MAG: hypothetical protein EA353_04395 [Puniceicoccaceae bacterium]|nr:MAG: hypothetical protein EA353_04395 [Puniceicoccaceae bacterium]
MAQALRPASIPLPAGISSSIIHKRTSDSHNAFFFGCPINFNRYMSERNDGRQRASLIVYDEKEGVLPIDYRCFQLLVFFVLPFSVYLLDGDD